METNYQITEQLNVLIPLPDGTHLSANLITPEGVGPAPAIIVYQPYLKDLHGRGDILRWQQHFARWGYACLTVDIRGTGASDGAMAPPFSPSEREDAVAMLAWVSAQPWCNGVTGMWGISYSGSTALAAASMRPPSLQAIVPMHGTANEYWGFLRPHGCRPAWWTEASWGPMMVLLSLLPPLARDPERRWARVWRDRLERLEPLPFVWHQVPFDQYMSWKTDASSIEAALFAVSGWHDYYPQATLDYFNAARGPRRVLIGGWKHEFPDLAVRGAVDHRIEMDRWWDRWLRDIENGVDQEPEVLIWHQGEDVWRYEESWPPQRSAVTTFYVDDGGRLGPVWPTESGRDERVVDPAVGLHLLPWDPQAPVTPMPYDRAADDHRCLTYDTAPLIDDLEIVGSPEAVICLSSDEPDFPLHVALCDVATDGRSTLVCQGWGSASLLAGEPMQPGQIYDLTVPLYSTSYRIARGHRLRLVISGADFPLLWPAPRNPRLSVLRGSNRGTHVRVPIARAVSDRIDLPWLCRPECDPSPIVEPGHNWISRDLTGESAAFDQRFERSHKLADGITLRIVEQTRSTVARSHPEDTVLTARLEAHLDRHSDPLHAVVETIQTLDGFHIEATITLVGKPFFHRFWDWSIGRN
jgi:putative CocE/NonD family hydrolase